MNSIYTVLGIDAISKDALQILVSKDGYFETAQEQLHDQQKFNVEIDNSRHTCILDVDHTLLFVRYFGDEMAVGDSVQYHQKPARVNSMIYEIQVHEEIEHRPTEFRTASYRAQIQHQDIPIKGALFTYIVENDDENIDTSNTNNQNIRQSIILNAEAVGCEVELEDGTLVQISFEDDSPELFALKPDMNRSTLAPVELLHDGFLVRIRPRLAEFLNEVNKHFNVILFTAAERDVYEGLLTRVHAKLLNAVPANEVSSKCLWKTVLYRESCDVRRFGPSTYHIKNLCKFGIDMGRIFIVDNNPGSFRGFEPNAICCGDYYGTKASDDNVLFGEVMPIVKSIIESQTTDVRYVLCNLPKELWSGDELSPREDSICEEEVAGYGGGSCCTPNGSTTTTSDFGGSFHTTVQSRRHSFHAGSTDELCKEISTDRTIQFVRCLRQTLGMNSRFGSTAAQTEFEDTLKRATSSFASSSSGEAGGSPMGFSIGCAGGSFSALLSKTTSRSGSETFPCETDSESDSIRTMVINADEEDVVMMEAGGCVTPRSDDSTKFLARGINSSMSVESNDEDLAMMGNCDGESSLTHNSRLTVQHHSGGCCSNCFCWRRPVERETRML